MTYQSTAAGALQLLNKLSGNKYLSLGIDQGSNAIRFVLLDKRTKKIIDTGCRILGAQQKEEIASFIKELSKKIPLKYLESINVIIQGNNISIGQVQVPVGENQDESQLIKLAVRSQIPFPVEKAVFYSHELESPSKSSDGNEKRTFQYVAAEKKMVSAIVNPIVDSFNIIPDVSIQGYALEKIGSEFGLYEKEERIAFINIGRGVTAISIFQKGELVFERDIPLAGQDITRSILIMYRPDGNPDQMLDLNEAEKLKKELSIQLPSDQTVSEEEKATETLASLGMEAEETKPSAGEEASQDSKLFKAVQGVLSAWVQDVKLSFNHFYENYGDQKVSKIFILGGSANFQNLVPYLEQMLDVKTHRLRSPESNKILYGSEVNQEKFEERFHEYALAYALALKKEGRGNLTPKEYNKVSYSNAVLPLLRILYVFLGSALLTWFLFLMVEGQNLKVLKNILSAQSAFLSKVERPYSEMVSWENFLRHSGSAYPKPSAILQVLSLKTPANTIVQSFSVDQEGGGVHIEGTILGDAKKQGVSVEEYSKALKQSGFFSKVDLLKLLSSSDEEERATFQIEAQLKKIRVA